MKGETSGALSGRRVLELADATGVYCGKLMADMGADVIKVEPCAGDATRSVPPFFEDRPGPDRGFFFLYMNTNKRSVALDLAQPEARTILRRLALASDIVIETGAPGRLDRLGCGYASLAAERPEIVVTSITGFGQTGPHRDWLATDMVAAAMGGAMAVTGDADAPPVVMAGGQCQLMASTCAASASLIALHHAGRTGRGQHVDISMQETTLAISHVAGVGKWLDDGIVPKRVGTSLTASVPSGAYPCQDGKVYLMVNRPAHWEALARWINEETGNEEVIDPLFEGPSSRRIEYRELLDLFITELTERHTVDEIYHEGQRRHIAFTPLGNPEDVARDAHLAARSFFVHLEQPGVGSLSMPGAPYRHERTPWSLGRPAPSIGQHTDEVLRDALGLADAEVARLRDTGAVG